MIENPIIAQRAKEDDERVESELHYEVAKALGKLRVLGYATDSCQCDGCKHLHTVKLESEYQEYKCYCRLKQCCKEDIVDEA